VIKVRSRHIGLFLLLALAAFLPGCFDYEVELTLEETGNGVMEVRLDLPAHLAKDNQANLDTIINPVPQVRREVRHGRLIMAERLEFQWLDVVAMRRMRFQVEQIGTGLLGLTDYRYRVTAWLESLEGDLPDRKVRPGLELAERKPAAGPSDSAAAKAARLLAGGMKGHYVSLTMNLPGEISEAWPLIVATAKVQPEITGGWIRWRVPMGLLASADVRNTLVFHCEFKGDFSFRGPTQSTASTRFPAEEDHKAAEKVKREQSETEPAAAQPKAAKKTEETTESDKTDAAKPETEKPEETKP
jgi:hypothetical protein